MTYKSNGSWSVCVLALVCLLVPLQLMANVEVQTSTLLLSFSEQGSLLEAQVCYPACADENARRLHLLSEAGIVGFEQNSEAKWVNRRGLDAAKSDGNSPAASDQPQQLYFSDATGQTIVWTIPAAGYRLEARVEQAQGQPNHALELRAGEEFKPRAAPGFGGWLEQVRYLGLGQEGVRQVGLDEDELTLMAADWAGYRNRFWTVLASGEDEGIFEILTGEDNSEVLLRRTLDRPSEQFMFYLGPVEPTELATADEMLDELLYAGLWFWLRWICFGLFYLLGWIQSVVPAWGLAIMILSVCVHVLMLPLSRIADRFQQQVNAIEARLAPELNRIKKEFRGEEQAAKIVALYKVERVHPLYSLKSMLGVAVVIPVFIGAFDMLAENINLLNTGFLWITDLSRPDDIASLPFTLPFFGSELNLLPFLMTGLSVAASALHSPPALDAELRKKQVRNMLLLAVAFFALFYTFPAGMVLYWTTNNLISVSKSLWARARQ